MENFREVRDEGHSQKEDYSKKRISKEDSTEAEKEKRKTDHGKETWRCPDPNCKKINPKEAQNCGQCKLSSKMARAHDDRKRDCFGGDRGWKGGRGGKSGGGRGGGSAQRTVRRIPNDVDATNPVVMQFVEYSHVLDDRHDRYERIVKLGRDITIEAKRIIFALHRIKTEKDKPCVLGEAEMRLGAVKKNLWREVAFELKDAEDWQFLRGYSSGLQEYVEALSLYHYLCYGKVISSEAVQEELKFRVRARKNKREGKGKKNEVKEGGTVDEKRVIEEGMVKAEEGKNENRNHLENANNELPEGLLNCVKSVRDAITVENGLHPYTCYSPLCRAEGPANCYSPSCRGSPKTSSLTTAAETYREVYKEAKVYEASKIDEPTENKDTDMKNLQVVVQESTSIVEDKIKKNEKITISTEDVKMDEPKENKLQVIVKEADSMILDKMEINEKQQISTEASKTNTAKETKAGDEYETLMVTIPQTDYILGLADLTGELMRNAINSVAVGNTEACFSLLALLQQMNEGFAKIDKVLLPRHVERKLEEFNRSLRKVEDACYAINVRGSELPKDHLGSVFERKADDGYHSHARDPIQDLYFGE